MTGLELEQARPGLHRDLLVRLLAMMGNSRPWPARSIVREGWASIPDANLCGAASASASCRACAGLAICMSPNQQRSWLLRRMQGRRILTWMRSW